MGAIGALNDVADADRDRGAKPRKPVAAGQVGRSMAAGVGIAGLCFGLMIAGATSFPVLLIGLAGAAVGLAYDFRLKGSPLSWLGFALGIPLLPIFAWVGATGMLPGPVMALAIVAVPSGFALAVANALSDLEADDAAGVGSVAVALGSRRAWLLGAVAQTALVVGAGAAFVAFGGLSGRGGPLPVLALIFSIALLALGVALGGSVSPGLRQLAWDLHALATRRMPAP